MIAPPRRFLSPNFPRGTVHGRQAVGLTGAVGPPRPARGGEAPGPQHTVNLRLVPFDDDAGADPSSFRPPPHPDDRLWRHPSEMRAHPIVPIDAPPVDAPPDDPPEGASRAGGSPRRPWGSFLVAAAVGAVLAGGGVVAFGVGERVVERPVTERVTLTPSTADLGAGDDEGLESVRRRVGPALVGLDASGPPSDPAAGAEAGYGVIVRDDGIVVTSAALVEDGVAPSVRLADGTVTEAEIVATDPTTGLAVLDVAGDHTPGVLATRADLVAGQTAVTLGADSSGAATAQPGVVGPARRTVGPSGAALEAIEIAGDPGHLAVGGPVVDDRGAIVGIVTAVDDEAWYVAPVEVVHRVTGELLDNGVVRHAWLGIEGTDVAEAGAAIDGPMADAPGAADGAGPLSSTASDAGGGTLVASVVPDSPADQGGLLRDDVIVALDGQPIAHMPDLSVALRSRSPGDRVDVTVTRADGSRVTLVLTLAEAPADLR